MEQQAESVFDAYADKLSGLSGFIEIAVPVSFSAILLWGTIFLWSKLTKSHDEKDLEIFMSKFSNNYGDILSPLLSLRVSLLILLLLFI